MTFTYDSKIKRWVSEKGSRITTSELVTLVHARHRNSVIRFDHEKCVIR